MSRLAIQTEAPSLEGAPSHRSQERYGELVMRRYGNGGGDQASGLTRAMTEEGRATGGTLATPTPL